MDQTVIDVLEATAARHGTRTALHWKGTESWESRTWAEHRNDVHCVARGFLELGLPAGAGVVIMGFNRPEWFVADLAAIAAGGVPAGLYTTLPPDQCRYIAGHCEAAIAVVENREYLERILAVRAELPHLGAIVLMDGSADELEGVVTWSDLVELGQSADPGPLAARIAALRADALATLIYTSGTTGPPKAVQMSHRNLVWTARAVVDQVEIGPDDRVISYLPLSHIAEQVVSLHGPLAVGAATFFAESIEKLGDNLREVRPTVFFAVPRVWEKIQARIQAVGADAPPLRRRIAAWARGIGLAGGYADQRGRSRPLLYPLARALVFDKARTKLGLDACRFAITSAAPISLDTLEFFLSLGIPILEVYGMSECTGPTTVSLPGRYRTGAAGFAIPGTELQVGEDGEILMRGPHVFLGYLKDEAATAEALDDEGWLHSGDIGEIDADGFLRVTDRKKELIITSGGKNVAPQMLEARLKSIPGVGQAVALGDRQKYVAALLALDAEGLSRVAETVGSPARTPAEAARCEVFRAYLESRVASVNDQLASYETIKRFEILPGELTVEGGELTPTMKLKRRVIAEKFAREIESLFT